MEALLLVGWLVLVIIAVILSYLLLILLGSIIPVNKRFMRSAGEIPVYICSNGVHTDFVVPTTHPLFDWSKVIASEPFQSELSTDSWIGLGWGDRGFYLEVPTWPELTMKVAARAMLIPSPTLMQVTLHKTPPSDKKYIEKLLLSKEQYLQLCRYISSYFKVMNGQIQLVPGVGYTPNDNFYEANGKYHAFNTCNFWVNRGLIKIGVRTALWSPIDRGIFYQLRKVKS